MTNKLAVRNFTTLDNQLMFNLDSFFLGDKKKKCNKLKCQVSGFIWVGLDEYYKNVREIKPFNTLQLNCKQWRKRKPQN